MIQAASRSGPARSGWRTRLTTVSRIDPQTNREVQAIPVGVTPTALAVVGGAVWVTSAEERSVTRIDVVRGRVVDRIPTDALGRGIAVGGGSVWVTDESSRSVVRIDARRGSVVETVSVGNGPTGVAFGDGSVWVANSLDGTVSRIDPGTNRVTAVIPVGEGPAIRGSLGDVDHRGHRFMPGSMRETVPSSEFATHTSLAESDAGRPVPHTHSSTTLPAEDRYGRRCGSTRP